MAKTATKKQESAPQQAPSSNLPANPAREKVSAIRQELDLRIGMMRTQLPSHLTAERVRDGVIKAISHNPKLLECSRLSVVNSALEAAECGLSVSPTLKEADILPVWGKGGPVAQFRPRYQGLMKLARQSGEIADIYAHIVREGDQFDYALGLDKKLHHVPKVNNMQPIIAAYCVWQTKDGIKSFEVMGHDEIEMIRDRSEGYKAFKDGKIKSTPWTTDFPEMCRKTVVRRASKYMPMSTDPFLKAMALDEAREIGRTARMVDGDVEVLHDAPVDITAAPDEAPAPTVSKNLDRLEQKVTAQEPTPQKAPEPPKAAAPAVAVGKPMPLPMADGQPDWDSWFTNATDAIKKLAPGEVAAWEKANEANIGAFGFFDADKAQDLRTFIAERSQG